MALHGPALQLRQPGAILAALVIGSVLFDVGWATPCAWAHDEHDWIRKGRYRSPLTNEWCCGHEDCVPVPSNQVESTPSGWRILPTDEVVPYVDTLRSEDGHFWRCHQPNGMRRCFFAPPGTS